MFEVVLERFVLKGFLFQESVEELLTGEEDFDGFFHGVCSAVTDCFSVVGWVGCKIFLPVFLHSLFFSSLLMSPSLQAVFFFLFFLIF